MSETLMIIAGEASGDLHGSALVEQLLAKKPETRILGIGGNRMQNAGMELVYHIKDMAFLGFTEVVRHIPFIRKVQKDLIEKIKLNNIKWVVLIDYPGFNLNFAKKIKKLGVKIVYYISPQIWAWGQHRIKKIKKLVDKMLVVFPFEEEFYRKHNVDAQFVGHPLIERINNFNFASAEETKKEAGIPEDSDYLLLMPGSRKHEINLLFDTMLKSAQKIASEFNLKIVVACSENIDENLFGPNTNIFKLVKGNTYNLIKHAKFGIIKSGTSTLEAALIGLPFLLVYKTSALTYLIGKSLIKIDSIAMPNIISGEKIIEELIQNEANADNIYKVASDYLNDTGKYENLKQKLNKIKDMLSLGNYSASQKAADIIGSLIYEVK